MTRILLDASGMAPLELPHDQWRPRLVHLLQGLRRAGAFSFVTTNWTLYEALALTRRRSAEASRSLYTHVSETMTVLPVGPEVESQSLARFLSWKDEQASVLDHANLLVALAWSCQAVLSFDSDFEPLAKAAGLRLLR